MAGCPCGVAVTNSSMESTCLRTRSASKCAPICGHSKSSRVMRSTESLAFFAGGEDRRSAGSVAADSFFLVALCTDALRESSSTRFAALQLNSTRGVERLSRLEVHDPYGNGDLTRCLGSHFGC